MQRLPNDLLVQVLRFLPLSEASTASRSCKRWCEAFQSDGMWIELLARDYFVVFFHGEFQPLRDDRNGSDGLLFARIATDGNGMSEDDWAIMSWREHVAQLTPATRATVEPRQDVFIATRRSIAKKMRFRNCGSGNGGVFFGRSPKDVYGMTHRRKFIEKRFHELSRMQKVGVVGMTCIMAPFLFLYHIPTMAVWVVEPLEETVGDIEDFFDAYLQGGFPTANVSRRFGPLRRCWGRLMALCAAPYVCWRVGRRRGWTASVKFVRGMIASDSRFTRRLRLIFWRAVMAAQNIYDQAFVPYVAAPCLDALGWLLSNACSTLSATRHVVLSAIRLAMFYVRVAARAAQWTAIRIRRFVVDTVLDVAGYIRLVFVDPSVAFCRTIYFLIGRPMLRYAADCVRLSTRAVLNVGRSVMQLAWDAVQRLASPVADAMCDTATELVVPACRAVGNGGRRLIVAVLYRFLWHTVILPAANNVVVPGFRHLARCIAWFSVGMWRCCKLAARLFYWSILRPVGTLAGKTFRFSKACISFAVVRGLSVAARVNVHCVQPCAAALYCAYAFVKEQAVLPIAHACNHCWLIARRAALSLAYQLKHSVSSSIAMSRERATAAIILMRVNAMVVLEASVVASNEAQVLVTLLLSRARHILGL